MYREKNSNDKTKIRNKLFVWCIVLALMAAISVADVGQGPAEADLWADAGTAEIQTSDSRERPDGHHHQSRAHLSLALRSHHARMSLTVERRTDGN